MKNNELKIFKTLVFLSVFYILYLFAFTTVIQDIDTSEPTDHFKLQFLLITTVGIHSICALILFCFSRIGCSNFIRDSLAIASILIPVAFLVYNYDDFIVIDINNVYFLLIIFSFIKFFLSDLRNELVKKYFRILLDPFYREGEQHFRF